MTQNRSHKTKRNYQSPLIVEVGIDNYITLQDPSYKPPEEPVDVASSPDDTEKKIFPDSPATDDPFGGSSPNYR